MYQIHGALGSPYSMKMRALLRYRRITHVWSHGATAQAAQAKLGAPVIPVLEYPDGTLAYDSTPLVYDLEQRHEGRSVIPPDPATAFIAHLLEDFADEWLTKAMFGYRWLEEVDQVQMSQWLAFDAFKGSGLDQINTYSSAFRERQVGRMGLVGCTRENFALIEASTRRVLQALEDHVTTRHFLFGTRPSIAELGIYGQISQLGVDPTAQNMMRADFPFAFRWLFHIDDMSGIKGEWDPAGTPPSPAVETLLAEAGKVYVPFLLANAAAAEAGEDTFRIEVDGLPYEQGMFKYQLKCLRDLRNRYAGLSADARATIDPILDQANCKGFLQ